MYGYENDEVSQGRVRFGLNPAAARLVKFEWINNAGKDGAEGEALDIQFAIEGSDKPTNYRMFPVTQAFGKNQEVITDPKAPEFQKALKDWNACITHILHAFVAPDVIKAGFATPIPNFKEFCKIAMKMLPANYEQQKLDIFYQWQWQIKGENKNTFLELPKKMSYGKWLCAAVVPSEGSDWKEWKHPDPEASTSIALKYVDGEGNQHPFIRNGWFMLSKFSSQQKQDVSLEGATDGTDTGTGEGAEGATTGAGGW